MKSKEKVGRRQVSSLWGPSMMWTILLWHAFPAVVDRILQKCSLNQVQWSQPHKSNQFSQVLGFVRAAWDSKVRSPELLWSWRSIGGRSTARRQLRAVLGRDPLQSMPWLEDSQQALCSEHTVCSYLMVPWWHWLSRMNVWPPQEATCLLFTFHEQGQILGFILSSECQNITKKGIQNIARMYNQMLTISMLLKEGLGDKQSRCYRLRVDLP